MFTSAIARISRYSFDKTLLSRGSLSYILKHSIPPKVLLSERQQDILRCLAKGATNRVIASKIDVDLITVKNRVRAVLYKIRARNRTQAAVWALRQWDNLQER
jgi:DNA-binding NarL/FixJ family response regulator